MVIERTLRHVIFLARHLRGCDIRCVTTAVLLELGVPDKNAGFDYLENAIILFVEDPTRMFTKDIYPTVGKLYTPPARAYQVERQIRTSINEAWENRDEQIWGCYFHAERDGVIRRPTNAEFISRVARFVLMWQGCCKEVSRNGE